MYLMNCYVGKVVKLMLIVLSLHMTSNEVFPLLELVLGFVQLSQGII